MFYIETYLLIASSLGIYLFSLYFIYNNNWIAPDCDTLHYFLYFFCKVAHVEQGL